MEDAIPEICDKGINIRKKNPVNCTVAQKLKGDTSSASKGFYE